MDTILVEVQVDPLGSALRVAAAVGDTELELDWVADFAEDGGDLAMDDVEYEYDSTNPELDTLTLSNPLPVALEAGTPVVAISNDAAAQVWTALVEVPGADEPIEVSIGSEWIPFFQLGDEMAGATVTIKDDGRGGYEVAGRPNQRVSMDLSNAVNVPDPAAVAIDAPTESPQIVHVEGNATGLTVVTDPVDATTLLDYYIDGVLVATDQRTNILNITTTDLAGTTMALATDYTVTVWAQNSAGSAPAPSMPRTARLNPGVTPEQVSATIRAGFILAGAIQVGTSMTLDPAGGFTITHPDGRQTYMRADGSGNQFVGQATLDALTTLGSVTMLGLDNFLNGVLTLGTGVGNPTDKPGVTPSYDYVENSGFGYGFYPLGLFADGTSWVMTDQLTYDGAVNFIDRATGVPTSSVTMPGNFAGYGGVVKVGTSWYVLGKDGARGADWYVYIFDSAWVKTGEWAPIGAPAESLTLGVDGSSLLIAKRTGSDTLYVSTYSTAGVETAAVNCGTWSGATLTGVVKRAVDTATVRYVVASTTAIRVFNTSSGARVSGEEWPVASSPIYGLGHDGSNWFSTDGARIWKYTNLIGSGDFGFTWVDNDAGGIGTAETKISDIRPITSLARAKWTISLPNPPPDDGTVDGANTARLYYTPSGGTLVLQATLAPGVLSQTFSTLATSGSAPPSVNGFAGRLGAIGRIVPAALHPDGDPLFDLPGDGVGAAGPLAWDAAGHALGRNSRLTPSATATCSPSAAPTGTGNVTIAGLSISLNCPGTDAVYEVTISADVSITTAGVVNIIELLVDGVAQTAQLITSGPAAMRAAGSKTWRLTGLAAGSRVLSARTRNATTANATVNQVHTTMVARQL